VSANFAGKHSEHQHQPGTKCPKCGQQQVFYLGSSVLHGNPYTPASDTEVSHHFACGACQHEYDDYA